MGSPKSSTLSFWTPNTKEHDWVSKVPFSHKMFSHPIFTPTQLVTIKKWCFTSYICINIWFFWLNYVFNKPIYIIYLCKFFRCKSFLSFKAILTFIRSLIIHILKLVISLVYDSVNMSGVLIYVFFDTKLVFIWRMSSLFIPNWYEYDFKYHLVRSKCHINTCEMGWIWIWNWYIYIFEIHTRVYEHWYGIVTKMIERERQFFPFLSLSFQIG
jgi:hypothetical protein